MLQHPPAQSLHGTFVRRPASCNEPNGLWQSSRTVARMFRALGRYGPSAVLAIAPLLTAQVSLLDLLPFGWGAGPDVNGSVDIAWLPDALGRGSKPEVEMKLRFLLTSAGVAWLIGFGYFDAYLPSRTLESFRHEYLSNVVSTQWRKGGRLRSSLRINVMYLRWRWFMPLGPSFTVVWKDKFHPSDRDGSLCLYRWQGRVWKGGGDQRSVLCGLPDGISGGHVVVTRVAPSGPVSHGALAGEEDAPPEGYPQRADVRCPRPGGQRAAVLRRRHQH